MSGPTTEGLPAFLPDRQYRPAATPTTETGKRLLAEPGAREREVMAGYAVAIEAEATTAALNALREWVVKRLAHPHWIHARIALLEEIDRMIAKHQPADGADRGPIRVEPLDEPLEPATAQKAERADAEQAARPLTLSKQKRLALASQAAAKRQRAAIEAEAALAVLTALLARVEGLPYTVDQSIPNSQHPDWWSSADVNRAAVTAAIREAMEGLPK